MLTHALLRRNKPYSNLTLPYSELLLKINGEEWLNTV